MNGQALVDRAELLTGRTTESAKMLSRINIIQKMLWTEYEWDFAIEQAQMITDVLSANQTFTYNQRSNEIDDIQSGAGFFNALASDGTHKGNGSWIYDTGTGAFIKISSNSGTTIETEGKINTGVASSFTGKWFRLSYSLENFAVNATTLAGASRRNFGRFRSAWVDGFGGELEIVSPGEWQRRVPQLDINATGRPEFATITHDWVQLMAIGGGSHSYQKGLVLKIWPISDAVYTVHYDYHTSPDDITLTSTPFPNDTMWHEALAFGAAWLTRLDDVDSSADVFKSEYDKWVDKLTWTYKITPNYAPSALGPRHSERGVAGSRIRPFG